MKITLLSEHSHLTPTDRKLIKEGIKANFFEKWFARKGSQNSFMLKKLRGGKYEVKKQYLEQQWIGKSKKRVSKLFCR